MVTKECKTLEQLKDEVAQNYIKDPEYQEYYKNWDDMFDDMDNGNAINFVGRAINEAAELYASQFKEALSEREELIKNLGGSLLSACEIIKAFQSTEIQSTSNVNIFLLDAGKSLEKAKPFIL